MIYLNRDSIAGEWYIYIPLQSNSRKGKSLAPQHLATALAFNSKSMGLGQSGAGKLYYLINIQQLWLLTSPLKDLIFYIIFTNKLMSLFYLFYSN